MRQTPPSRYLSIELNLQTVTNEPQPNSVPKLIIFLDPQGRYHFGRGLTELKRAIIGMSLEANNNTNRHLGFDLTVLRGTRSDAYNDAINRDYSQPRRRRTNRDNYY